MTNSAQTSQQTLHRTWWSRQWFAPVPGERLAVFSRIVHLTVLYTVFVTDRWAADHAWAPRAFWQPVALARWLSIPAPEPSTMSALQIVLAVSAVAAIAGFGPRRMVNAVVAGAYGWWLVWAFSFSKVDHDRLTIVVALAVLVIVPGTTRGPDPLARWALRTVQIVFVLAYPLSALAKIERSGLAWMSSAVFARAIVRRGSSLGDWFVTRPGLLQVGQWMFITFEVVAVAALVRRARLRTAVLAGIVALHAFTYLTIGISFLPHTICIAAFLPLERLHPGWRRGERTDSSDVTGPTSAPTDRSVGSVVA